MSSPLSAFAAMFGPSPTDAAYARQLARLDADADGALSAAEWRAGADDGSFAAADLDGDGAVSVAEWAQWFQTTPPRPVAAAHVVVAEPAAESTLVFVAAGLGAGVLAGIGLGVILSRFRRRR